MTDMLIRDVPDDVIAAVDARAALWVCPAASTFAVGWLRMAPRPALR